MRFYVIYYVNHKLVKGNMNGKKEGLYRKRYNREGFI